MLKNLSFWEKKKNNEEIDPDEILLDSSNICKFDTSQFEGRLEKPISKFSLYSILIFAIIIFGGFVVQLINLQINNGSTYRERSEKNILRPVPIFAGRGVIYDRNNTLLVWNSPNANTEKIDLSSATSSIRLKEDTISKREYATSTGLAHILGYVQYPAKDKNGYYYNEDFVGMDGIEKYYNQILSGENGSRLVEVDVQGNRISENVIKPPIQGKNIVLSIDSMVTHGLYENIKDIAQSVGFTGGAGMIMNAQTGEVIALASYPEYNSQVMSDRNDSAKIKSLLNDSSLPFLNRAVSGLYTPGSVVKPYIAIGALSEKIIDPSTIIVTTGSISIANPYDQTKSTIFKDWKNLGALDMRHAIAMSSDAYFYTIGGGYKDQKGLGIARIDKYLTMFGFGTSTLPSFFAGKAGTIPTPEWKKKTFNEDWYLGNTYHTAIGQYGFQVTVVQMVRAVAALVNGGKILTPTIVKDEILPIDHTINIPEQYFKVVREGMRLGVEIGTGKALNMPFVKIAAKTGTAELGESRQKVNSWVTGFWPYEKPKYVFAVNLEKGSVHNLIGAVAVMKQQLEWMNIYTPQYFLDADMD